MNRNLYKQPFVLQDSPSYGCPQCDIGLLRLNEDDFKKYTTFDLDEMQKHPDFEPDWIDYIFNCVFECNNHKCDGKVVCTGRGKVDFDIDVDDEGRQYQEWNDYYQPLFFHPNIKLINIPENTPVDIKKTLDQSFELFFTSPSAAANLVRISIEEILTDQGVSLYITNKKGREIRLQLDQRIDKLPEKHKDLKDKFFALKWLGNAGSHSGEELSLDDTMDAYELAEYVLSEIYRSSSDNLDKLTQAINTSKGPRRNKRLSN